MCFKSDERFALTQDGSKVDIKLRNIVNKGVSIEAEIDGTEFSKLIET